MTGKGQLLQSAAMRDTTATRHREMTRINQIRFNSSDHASKRATGIAADVGRTEAIKQSLDVLSNAIEEHHPNASHIPQIIVQSISFHSNPCRKPALLSSRIQRIVSRKDYIMKWFGVSAVCKLLDRSCFRSGNRTIESVFARNDVTMGAALLKTRQIG